MNWEATKHQIKNGLGGDKTSNDVSLVPLVGTGEGPFGAILNTHTHTKTHAQHSHEKTRTL